MSKKSNRNIIIISCLAAAILLGYGGWKVYSLFTFFGDAKQMVGDSDKFWKEYESKPRAYYESFATACNNLLSTYSNYTDYPFYIPIADNPTLPDIISKTNPETITVWSKKHLSVTMVSFRGDPKMGFHITCKSEPDGTFNIFLGADWNEGYNVYSLKGM